MKTFFQKKLISDLASCSSTRPGGNLQNSRLYGKTENGPTVLIVDDEPSTLELLSFLLSDKKLNPITALSVKQAKSCLSAHPETALIICDLRMPEEDGFVLLEYLNNHVSYKHIPVIVSSSCANEEIVREAIALGAIEYVNKPYSKEMIYSRVKCLLDAARRRVLLVSDDEVVPTLLKRALRREKFAIIAAVNGTQALSLINDSNVDIIISELALPDMTGFDLMTSVFNMNKWIPVVFLGDPQLPVSEVDVISIGGHGLIPRPFNNIDIKRKIEKLAHMK